MAKILVIDDDSAVRSTIGRILQRKGYEVVFAENGLRGVAVFHEELPDLVITDMIMPGQDGVETIRAILRVRPDAKIIAASGGGRVGNTDFLGMAREVGACDTISKPADPGEIISRVQRWLDAPEAAGSTSA
jgi:CheY-like chemotaxis protein